MRGFFDYTRSNRAGVVGKVSGSTLATPVLQAWPKFGKSLPGTKINMCTATTRPKEVAHPRLRAYLRGLGETFPMSYQRQVGWHFWPSSTRYHIPLTRSLVSDSVLNFAHFSPLTLSDDPCATVLVLLRFRLGQGFNLSYQWQSRSIRRLKNQKRAEFLISWPTVGCTNPLGPKPLG